jgi:chromosome segregation ATPase
MELVKTLREYADKLEQAGKALEKLEKQSQEIRGRHNEVCAEREELKEGIRGRRRTIATLESEREQLKGGYSDSLFDSDVQKQQRIIKRRNTIDSDLKSNREGLQRLHTAFEAIQTPNSVEVIDAAIALDSLNVPDVWAIAADLKDALTKHTTDVRNRISQSKRTLPEYDTEEYDLVRRQGDADYRSRQESKERRLDALAKLAENREAAKGRPLRRVTKASDLHQHGQAIVTDAGEEVTVSDFVR